MSVVSREFCDGIPHWRGQRRAQRTFTGGLPPATGIAATLCGPLFLMEQVLDWGWRWGRGACLGTHGGAKATLLPPSRADEAPGRGSDLASPPWRPCWCLGLCS